MPTSRCLDLTRVLALSTGPHTTLAVTRVLVARGTSVVVGVPDDERYPTAAVLRHAASLIRLPRPDRPSFGPVLLDLLDRSPVDVVLPLDDRWLPALLRHAEAVGRRAALAMPPPEAARWALDKSRTLVEPPGGVHPLPPPRTFAPTDPSTAVADWGNAYPAIVKPRSAAGARGIRAVRNARELAAAYPWVHERFPSPLIQEFVDYAPDDKFGLLYLFGADGRLRTRFMHRMILERRSIRAARGRPWRGGISLLWQSWFDAELLDRGERLLEGMGWRGFAEVECVRERGSGRARLMEVNARLPGTIPLALNLGIDFAHDACLVALGREPATRLDYPTRRRGRQDVLTLLLSGRGRALLHAFDPRFAAPNPWRDELGLVCSEIGRLAGKHWRRLAGRT